MYNHLVLSALRGGVILNRQNYSPVFMCISKGEYQRVSGAGIRPFRVFRFLHFLWSKCREMKKKSLKKGFLMRFFSAGAGNF